MKRGISEVVARAHGGTLVEVDENLSLVAYGNTMHGIHYESRIFVLVLHNPFQARPSVR